MTTLGVLGGGQLGRYTVIAAHELGVRTVVLDPDVDSPAGRLAHRHLVAAYDDASAVAELAAECDVVTTEFENPPAASLDSLGASVVVRPSAAAVAVCQDRRAEKRFATQHRLPAGPYTVIETMGDADAAATQGHLLFPARLKTAREGYDGKGQLVVDRPDQLTAAWRSLGAVPCVLERQQELATELSVLVARTHDGLTTTWPVMENRHDHGILTLTVVPATVTAAVAVRAVALAERIAVALAYVGVMAVELFVTVDGEVLVNELAPRPHNSGHWTLDACVTSQFEQQVRAALGLTLGTTAMTAPAAAMVNLLGDLWPEGRAPDWTPVLAHPAAKLHLYGKAVARPGRKMGHVTVVGDDPTRCRDDALAILDALRRAARSGEGHAGRR